MVARTRRARVTGIGGIFFKAKDPKALVGWYRRHLGSPSRTRWPSSRGGVGRRARQKDTRSGPFSLRKHLAPGQKRGRSCDRGGSNVGDRCRRQGEDASGTLRARI